MFFRLYSGALLFLNMGQMIRSGERQVHVDTLYTPAQIPPPSLGNNLATAALVLHSSRRMNTFSLPNDVGYISVSAFLSRAAAALIHTANETTGLKGMNRCDLCGAQHQLINGPQRSIRRSFLFIFSPFCFFYITVHINSGVICWACCARLFSPLFSPSLCMLDVSSLHLPFLVLL